MIRGAFKMVPVSQDLLLVHRLQWSSHFNERTAESKKQACHRKVAMGSIKERPHLPKTPKICLSCFLSLFLDVLEGNLLGGATKKDTNPHKRQIKNNNIYDWLMPAYQLHTKSEIHYGFCIDMSRAN